MKPTNRLTKTERAWLGGSLAYLVLGLVFCLSIRNATAASGPLLFPAELSPWGFPLACFLYYRAFRARIKGGAGSKTGRTA
jgi:hypothetical protein